MGHPPCVESVITGGQPASATAGFDGDRRRLAAQGWDRCIPSRHHTGPDCTSIGELENPVINYHLQSYVMDRSMVFFLNLGGC